MSNVIRLPRVTARRNTDFLPAVVEIMETPPSPLRRLTLWLIILFVVIGSAWAWFGRVDMISVARGAVLPSSRTQVVQPLQAGVVLAIHVHNGDRVAPGDLLVELDGTAARADIAAYSRAVMADGVETARLRAALAAEMALDAPIPAMVPPGEADGRLVEDARARLRFQVEGVRAQLAGLTEEASRARASIGEINADIARLEETIPLAGQLSDARDLLAGKGLGSRLEALQERQRAISQRHELVAARARAEKATIEVAMIEQRRAAALADFRRDAATQLATTEARLEGGIAELAKARQRLREQRLTAPIAGTVEEVAVHTIGGVVTPAQALMSVVPLGDRLEIEAKMLDRDAGFVEVGQVAVVKLDAFPFTRHGTLQGTVSGIAKDAVQDEHLGPVYKIRVALDGDLPGPRPQAGMAGSVEVRTGDRRVADYVLSPLEQRTREAFHER